MLVLSRKVKQKFRIGNDIVITVLKVQGEQVSIGIEAPRELPIVREELIFEELEKSVQQVNIESAVDKTIESLELKNS